MTIIPLFILMGEFAFFSGLITGAYSFMNKWLGHLPGGLAMATIGGCAAFASICGTSVATASTMTTVAYPEMRRFQYDPKLALGAISCGGTLGILIPPSNPMVIYAIFAEASVGKLFMGGILPGILMTCLLISAIFIWVKINPTLAPRAKSSSWMERIKAFKDIWPVAILALIVLGGIYGGVFTAMEAAGVGAFGALAIGLILRKIKGQGITSALNNAITTSAMVFVIMIGAMIFNYFIVLSGLPVQLANMVLGFGLPPMGVLAAILFIYFILGCIMDTMAMTVLTLPIFLPILTGLQFDMVWFGIIFVVMCEIALVTPPIGMNVFVIAGMVKEVPMYTIFRGIVPFLIAELICLGLIIAFPQIALLIPQNMIR
jgi:tripartite ATP-independent transporter DctM subunit